MKRGKLAADRVGVFDIADGAFGPGGEAGNAFIAFGSDAGRKRDRGVHADLVSPRGADPRQIVREDERGAGPVGAMDRNDGLVGQGKTRIEIANRPGVPFGDLAEVNVREHGSGQSQLSRADAFDVDHRRHAADDDGKLNEARRGQFLRTQRRIGSAEIHRPAFDLPDADARSDGQVVDRHPGQRPRRLPPIWPKPGTRTSNRLPARLPRGLAYPGSPNTTPRRRPERQRAGARKVSLRFDLSKSFALARSRRRSARSDAMLAAELQP